MAVNWNAGLMRWKPYVDEKGQAYPLNHLHPLRYDVLLEGGHDKPELLVHVYVGFGMHCFTRKIADGDGSSSLYTDDRESRTFCHERYQLSKLLPEIARTLGVRQCGFAKNENFVTIDINGQGDSSVRYAVFFNVKAWKERGMNSVLVVIQSAYGLSLEKLVPSKGKIRFHVLLGHALRGTKPKKP